MSGFIIKHKRGITGTLIFHLGLVILFIFSGLITPLPLPEEEGILINFGTSYEGEGFIEPSATLQTQAVEQAEPIPSETTIQPGKTEEEILTQDLEEAPVVESKALEEERKREEELERQRLEKIERERLEELERQRQEELERQRIIEEQKRIQEITDRTRNALSNTLNNADNTATGEGETTGQGNQGSETGSVNSDNHSSGISGLGDKGISFSLEGRTPQSLPKPEYNYQAEGIVVVEVTVNQNGNVTKATAGVKGSTTLDNNLLKAAQKAALAAKFDRKPNAAAFQKGTITYHFLLQ
ncbi:MAG: TonB family protein [Bacteroidales bacterium]|nr:TonB family protein [Bacteroidales bacterium]